MAPLPISVSPSLTSRSFFPFPLSAAFFEWNFLPPFLQPHHIFFILFPLHGAKSVILSHGVRLCWLLTWSTLPWTVTISDQFPLFCHLLIRTSLTHSPSASHTRHASSHVGMLLLLSWMQWKSRIQLNICTFAVAMICPCGIAEDCIYVCVYVCL